MFLQTKDFYLEALDNKWAEHFAQGIVGGVSSKYTFTGSVPMRQIDVVDVWDKERKAGSVMWAIFTDDRFIGVVGLHSHRDIYRSWEFRIFIFDVSGHQRGIGGECTRLVTRYAFERLNAHRVWGGTHADNIGMQKCFLKAGYKEEGRLREELYCFGKYSDAVRYGVLENEFIDLQVNSSKLSE